MRCLCHPLSRRLVFVLAAILLSPATISTAGEPSPAKAEVESKTNAKREENGPDHFKANVLPILSARCGKCHGAETQEANVRFDLLSVDLAHNRAAAETWREARNAILAGEMPPEDEVPLSSVERDTVVNWVDAAVRQAIEQQRSSGGRVVLRRLNRVEYQNTMFDLLGLEMDYTRDLPPDAVSSDGYTNNGQSLRMSAMQLEYYLDTARRALDRVIVHGPPPRVFRHRFTKSNMGGWRGATEKSNRLERAQKFLAKIVDDYPESGEFRVRVQARTELKSDKGFPLLEVAVGYRPDTEVHFAIAGIKEVVSEDLQQFEFHGRMENFPLPVRGQGKYPGLVVRLRNTYDDGTPMPRKLEKLQRNGKEVQAFRPEPDLPALLIEHVEIEAPYFEQWPPKSHRRILFESDLRDRNEVEYVRQVLHRFMTRAYRRPPTQLEVEDMFGFFASIRPEFTRFEDAIRETLAMVLIQPDFLYLMERGGDGKRPTSEWELATRLSYFLWSTTPDERLSQLAKLNVLHQPDVLESEVERMLASNRAEQFATQFVTQWLRLDRVEHIAVDRKANPGFKDELKPAIQRETTAFFATLLRSDESALNILHSDFAMLNEPLARHYGIDTVLGQRFRRVQLAKADHRGGVLGQASILLANSSGRDSHPIRRAVFIRDRLLGDPPAPPPPDVPELDEANPDFATLSVREQLEVHRNKESCRACHRDIDPWGIALENFDAVGRWRDAIVHGHGETSSERPVQAKATLPDGTILNGADGLRAYLTEHRQQDFAQTLVKSLMTYALGRTLELSDDAEVDDLTKMFMSDGMRLRPLIQRMVAGSAFRTK